ncbi:MAG: D-alanine--D-alanine ligase [Candidatus Abyssubacteria bacterium]
MRIGITYDLRQDYLDQGFGEEETAEFDRLDTIEAIERALQNLGHKTDRVGNVWNLARRLVNGDRWDMVFNIAEGLRGFGREAQVPALLEAYDIPYTFSDPMVLSLTLHKAMAKRVVRDIGVPTPDFAVVECMEDAERVNLPFPVFAKPVAEGTGKGITSESKIDDRDQLLAVCTRLLEQFRQPVLIETFLPGREFTVGIVGRGRESVALGVIEVVLRKQAEPSAYSYQNKKDWEARVEYHLVESHIADKAAEVALAAWRGLGCRDGGRVDVRADAAGLPHFLEVNPLAGLNPDHSDLCFIAYKVGMTYDELIGTILTSAIRRYWTDGSHHERKNYRHHAQRTRPLGSRIL